MGFGLGDGCRDFVEFVIGGGLGNGCGEEMVNVG